MFSGRSLRGARDMYGYIVRTNSRSEHRPLRVKNQPAPRTNRERFPIVPKYTNMDNPITADTYTGIRVGAKGFILQR